MRRIAFLSEHASPLALLGSQDAGGQNVYVDQVSRSLGRLGLEVDVFTRRDNIDMPETVRWAPGVRVVNLKAGPPSFVPKDELWPHMPAFRDSFLRFATQTGARYDVVHGNFWMSGWVTVELRRRLRLPAVQIFHAMGKTKQRHQGKADTSPRERIGVEIKVVRHVDALIAQCPNERDELVNDYEAVPAKVHTIPSAVNLETFHPTPLDEARHRIGLPVEGLVVAYIGRMLPRKDVRNLLRAVALLRERHPELPPVTLLLVGGETAEPDPVATPEIGALMRLGEELGIRKLMRFEGMRQPHELHNYYCAANVVVTTPWYETFGLTPLEAMACGRPVIGAAVGGIAFTVKHGETGLLAPPRDPLALAEQIAFLLERPELQGRMGRAARRRVEREFTWEIVAERTAALYEHALTEHAPALAPIATEITSELTEV